ncbi:nudC domain-containing protein 3 [Hypomesus transpacificus]|uniref:nudC domain-containing protein 3 n=1 Tax=Hypomesus transpacificus TaxID=137520 RepID=UPI001F07A26E|nr:nudC domain-containing protein 3 [Hypomesus transpacificus]
MPTMSSPMEMTELYDNALLGILQHVGNIQNFLQVYFGFLYRKTDFYRLLSTPNDRMGFPPGVAEKMVLKTFRLFERVAEQDRERQRRELQEREEARAVPPAVQELEVTAIQPEEASEPKTEPAQTATDQLSAGPGPLSASTSKQDPSPQTQSNSPAQGSPALAASTDSAEAAATAGQDKFQANPESYNGAVRDNYSWSQDYTDVEVRVQVPAHVVKGRQVSVSLQMSSVRVCLREGTGERVLIEGELTHKINIENSLWSLEPGRCVVLSLSKCGEVWWSAVMMGEKEIDINQINRERSMATVDEEEHAVLDRLTFDYQQKLQGKPQSHEMKVHDMLKKGWEAEGSPFKGQQFDPSMFDIPPSAVQF